MPCDTRRRRGQSLSVRKEEVRKVMYDVNSLIAAGKVTPVVDRATGSIAFKGILDAIRDDVTDACILRGMLANGNSLTRAAIARAEQLAGRTINKQAVSQGIHSHDGGDTWHNGH